MDLEAVALTTEEGRKRRASDHSEASPSKRMKEGIIPPFLIRLWKAQNEDFEELEEIDYTSPQDRGFSIILEDICRARGNLFEFAPTTATELVVLQHDWESDGHSPTLFDGLCVVRNHVTTMKEHLESVLELLKIIKDCDGLEVVRGKLKHEHDCQGATIEPDQMPAEKSPDPTVSKVAEADNPPESRKVTI